MPLSVGDRIARYEIRGFLGAGGMGEVYRAHDHRLNRDVAIKVLPERFAGDPDRLRRFEREARAAALDHPNILDVHDVGEHEGQPFIVTELLEGASLREVIASGDLTLQKALDYARQIATGLAAAHDHGTTHRDLKPANIFVTREGRIKILDFGLAKLAHPESSAEELSISPTQSVQTDIGVAMGTPGYMAPEQLHGRPADQRSDVFSFGIVIFEMVTGRHPFPGDSSTQIQVAILREDPPNLSQIIPKVPPLLDHLVARCLEKRPDDRFKSARELLFSLEELSTGEVATRRPPTRSPLVRRALMVAVTVAAVIFAAVIFQRSSQGVPFRERDWLLITDFENLTGDATLDRALDPALTVAIEQSSYVNVLSRDSMQRVLQQMKREDATAIDESVGREIARRKGVDVILTPSISRVGHRYALTASLKDTVSGDTYVSRLVHADEDDDLLPALDRLCREIRGALGETLASITERSKPLVEATTTSLEALEQYSIAHNCHIRSDPEGAMQHYEAALRFDPGFTSAKAALGILHLDWGHVLPGADPEKGGALLSEAAAETDSLTDLERLAILAHYAQFVEKDLEHAAQISETLLSIYPDRTENRHNLALIYERMGRTDDAIAEYKRAIETDPDLIVAYNGLIWLLRRVYGDVDAIIEWANREIEIADDQPWAYLNLSQAYLGKGDAPNAVLAARRGVEIYPNSFYSHFQLGHALYLAGEFEEAVGAYERVDALAPTEYWALFFMGIALQENGDSEAARNRLTGFAEAVEDEIEQNPNNMTFKLWLDLARIRLGEEALTRLTPEELANPNPDFNWNLAQLYSLTGRSQDAIGRLERALANGAEYPIWTLCIPTLDALHDEPRYQELKRKTLKLDKGS